MSLDNNKTIKLDIQEELIAKMLRQRNIINSEIKNRFNSFQELANENRNKVSPITKEAMKAYYLTLVKYQKFLIDFKEVLKSTINSELPDINLIKLLTLVESELDQALNQTPPDILAQQFEVIL